jgi:nitrogen fixation protein NifU and related proteins
MTPQNRADLSKGPGSMTDIKDPIDAFVDSLQEQIFDETRKAYGEAGFQRWRHPLYNGSMESPDSHARITGQCGDTIEMFLVFEEGRVKKATYTTDGCGASTVCGSFTAEMALGKTPDELVEITGEKVLAAIGTFPKEDQHCAFLAAETLQAALENYMQNSVC